MDKLEHWLGKFSRLRVDLDVVKGRAPHKPLLLLAVLDMLESAPPSDRWISLSVDLVVRFQNFWPIVEPRRQNKGDVRMPFHALATDGVWTVHESDGRPSKARSTSVLAQLHPDLASLLAEPQFRHELRHLLIVGYFTLDEQIALSAALGIAVARREQTQEAGLGPTHHQIMRQAGRSARFKISVVSGYRYTCVLTGYRLTTVDQVSLVEAAHIRSFASSRNNDPDNGLALTPTAHALFDLGLWSISPEGRIVVRRDAFAESHLGEAGFSLRAVHGCPLHLEKGVSLRPNPEHIAWHLKRHGFDV
jgi:putative restriction endonuclease